MRVGGGNKTSQSSVSIICDLLARTIFDLKFPILEWVVWKEVHRLKQL